MATKPTKACSRVLTTKLARQAAIDREKGLSIDEGQHGLDVCMPPGNNHYCVVRNGRLHKRFRFYATAKKHQGPGYVISSQDAHKYQEK